MTPGDIPPRPDRQTGEPQPPHAPAYEGRDVGDVGPRPGPPPGCGPALAWYREGRWAGVVSYVIFFVLAALFLTVYGWASTEDPLQWARMWPTLAFVVIFPLLPAFTIKGRRCAAGADWVRVRKSWVSIYELAIISVRHSSGVELKLVDGDGREVEANFVILQHNQKIWDLLYNGLLHSTVNGAVVSPTAIKYLRLPDSEENRANNNDLY